MKFLILIDMSPLTVFLEALGRNLKSMGHEVIWGCESRLPIIKYNLELEGEKIFLSDHVFEKEDCELKISNYGYIMFPNYDRDFELGLLKKGRYDSNIAKKMLCYFQNIFQDMSPGFVIYENVSNSFSYAAYLIAKRYGKKYLGLIGSRIPGRFEVWQSPFGVQNEIKTLMNLDTNYDDGVLKFTENCIRRKQPPLPDYMRNNPFSYKKKYILHYFNKVKKDPFLLSRLFDLRASAESKNCLQSSSLFMQVWKSVMRNFRRKICLFRLKGMFENISKEEKFFLYPLHYHPESSTSVLSPYFVDEDVVIKNISFNLPDGYLLYVKEHPNAAGFKSISFYRKIKNLPNVRCVDYGMKTQELIEKCQGVITLTSTMGFEALLHHKPVFVMGDAFYLPHKACFKLREFSQIIEKYHRFRSEIKNRNDFFVNENKRFLNAYFCATHKGMLVLDKNDPKFFPEVKNVANIIVSHGSLR